MKKLLIDKINILPNNLTISTENLWHSINQATSVLIVDINDQSILFANPNSLKELRIIENNKDLTLLDIVGKKFKLPVTYGEKFSCSFESFDGSSSLIEIVNSVVTWNRAPAFMLIMKSCDIP